MSGSSNHHCGHSTSCNVVARTFFFVSAREQVQFLWLQRACCNLKLDNGRGEIRWNCAHFTGEGTGSVTLSCTFAHSPVLSCSSLLPRFSPSSLCKFSHPSSLFHLSILWFSAFLRQHCKPSSIVLLSPCFLLYVSPVSGLSSHHP